MYKFFVIHDYQIFPSIVEIEADNQFDAFTKLIEKLKGRTDIGVISKIEMKVG